MEEVIVVDSTDKEIGTMEKLEAHVKGTLHRAFSVVVFNSKGEVLLQKRAQSKYHSAGLWTNTCCSHPTPGEKMETAIHRRLKEEMGFDTELTFAYKFIYRTELEKNLIENEYDHVYTGIYNDRPSINKTEVEDWKYASVPWLKKDMKENPDHYTHWFKLIMNDPNFRFRS
jgi:isopentenyl-diphosphate Delta-isomerase